MKAAFQARAEGSTALEGRVAPRGRAKGSPWLKLLALLLVLVTVGSLGWRQMTALPTVTEEPATMRDLWSSFTAEGVVRGMEYQLSAEVGGRVVELHVREGAVVRRGQTLMRLDGEQPAWLVAEMTAAHNSALNAVRQAREERDLLMKRHDAGLAAARAQIRQAELQHSDLMSGARPQEISQAQQAVARARAARDEANRVLERARTLYAEGFTARANVEKAEMAATVAQADLSASEAAEALLRAGPTQERIAVSLSAVDAAKAELKRVESERGAIDVAQRAIEVASGQATRARAALEGARAAVRRQAILAPADGIVTKLHVEVGSIVVPGMIALVISSRNDLRIEAEISTEDAAKVKQGMEVTITSAAYPGRKFPARVRSVMPAGELKPDAAIRTRIVRARIELQKHEALFRPGMEVDVEGATNLGMRVTVPTDAVRFEGDQASVYVLVDGIVVERKVKIGAQSSDRTEVLSGLGVGDEVILRGKDELKPGAKARAVR